MDLPQSIPGLCGLDEMRGSSYNNVLNVDAEVIKVSNADHVTCNTVTDILVKGYVTFVTKIITY